MNEQRLGILKRIIKEAGKILLKYSSQKLKISLKEDNSLICGADKESSEFIFNSLKFFSPQWGIIDEERKKKFGELNKEYCWIVDPLDCTRGYLNHEDTFSILIGLLNNKKPIFGISYRPAIGEIIFASKGKGAYMENSREIRKIKANSLLELSLLTSRSRKSQRLDKIISLINPAEIIQMGGSTKIIEIAKGTANLFICPKGNVMYSWDLCAPQIILEESGGKMSDLEGRSIDYSKEDYAHSNGIIAANTEVYHSVSEKICMIKDK